MEWVEHNGGYISGNFHIQKLKKWKFPHEQWHQWKLYCAGEFIGVYISHQAAKLDAASYQEYLLGKTSNRWPGSPEERRKR